MSDTAIRIEGEADTADVALSIGAQRLHWSLWRGETREEFRARVLADAGRLGVAAVRFQPQRGASQ